MPVATQVKSGNVIKLDGKLYRIIKTVHITPGKGNAIVQTQLRGLADGVKTEKRFRSSEEVETVDVFSRVMQFLYEGDGIYHFMDNENYEQYELTQDILGDDTVFLVAESNYTVDIYEEKPIGITLPERVTVKIAETDPAQKGSAGKVKPAKTDAGLTVKVPLFLAEGDSIVVNTSSKEYVERA